MKLICRRSLNSFISFQLALPNGRAEEIKRIEELCGPFARLISWNQQSKGSCDWLLSLGLLVIGWVMSAAALHGSAQESKPNQTNSTNHEQQKKSNSSAVNLSLKKMNETSGAPRPANWPRQAHQHNSISLLPLREMKKWSWVEWKRGIEKVL